MAFVAQSILSDSLAKGHIGQLNISLDSWTDTNIPSVTAGSWAQVAGTIYYATGDTTIDGSGVLLAGANSTIFYYAIDSVALDIVCTSTAPTWFDDKSEWGITISTHYCRVLGSVFKDGSGNITQKSIWYGRDFGILASGLTVAIGANADRKINFATDCSILWDESEDEFNINKDINIGSNFYYGDFTYKEGNNTLLKQQSGIGNTDFYIKKPVSTYFVGAAVSVNYGLQIYQNGGYQTITTANYAGATVYNIQLNPGSYRIYSAGAGVSSLYCSGVFGRGTITASEIVT